MSQTQQGPATDINSGLDFERARARLNQLAGEAFRHYVTLKNDNEATDAEVTTARNAYDKANEAYRNLRRTDTETIGRVLGGAR